MRHVFLINPHAGKQDQTARIRALADRLAAAHNLDCRCLLTDRPGGAPPPRTPDLPHRCPAAAQDRRKALRRSVRRF